MVYKPNGVHSMALNINAIFAGGKQIKPTKDTDTSNAIGDDIDEKVSKDYIDILGFDPDELFGNKTKDKAMKEKKIALVGLYGNQVIWY